MEHGLSTDLELIDSARPMKLGGREICFRRLYFEVVSRPIESIHVINAIPRNP
jgi:hypothetical protein